MTCQQCCDQINLRLDSLFAELTALDAWIKKVNKTVLALDTALGNQVAINTALLKDIDAASRAVEQLTLGFSQLTGLDS